MDAKKIKQTSKKLSYVLRHAPQSIGIELQPGGWVEVEQLLAGMAERGRVITREFLETVVEQNDKRRFELSECKSQIRARQGHSVEVDLLYQPSTPPDVLYQGTATRFLESIMEQGLLKGSRHHVHLSENKSTLLQVGSRHGKPAVVAVDAKAMHQEGHEFFVTGNEVWLTDHVPPQFLKPIDLSELD